MLSSWKCSYVTLTFKCFPASHPFHHQPTPEKYFSGSMRSISPPPWEGFLRLAHQRRMFTHQPGAGTSKGFFPKLFLCFNAHPPKTNCYRILSLPVKQENEFLDIFVWGKNFNDQWVGQKTNTFEITTRSYYSNALKQMLSFFHSPH